MKETNEKDTHLLLYCRIGSKELLPFDEKFFAQIQWLVDDIEYTPSETGLIACIRSKIDMQMLHLQLIEYTKKRKNSEPAILIDLKSGNAKGNLRKIKKKDYEKFKFDPFIGKRTNMEIIKEEEKKEISEETINKILDEISKNGVDSLESKKLEILKAYSLYLRAANG